MIMPFISSFEVINVVTFDPNISNGIKTALVNSLSTFPVKGNPVLSNGAKSNT